jgi:glycosyltransferase involved in cell wall biosynthesis
VSAPPRIALVTDELERPAARRLLQGLLERDLDAHLIVALRNCSEPTLHLEPRVHECIPNGRLRTVDRQLRTLLARLRPQVVHAQSLELALVAREAATLAGASTVATIAGDGVELGSYTGREAPWHAVDAVHLGDDASVRLAERRGLPDHVARAIVPPAAEPDPIARSYHLAPGGAPVEIVSVAPMHWTQGLEDAIKAVSLAVADGVDARYTIVGRGEHLPALAFARHQCGIADRVELRDSAPARDLRRAQIGLGAQVIDGLSPGVVRMMASGVPLAITDPGLYADHSPLAGAALSASRRDPRSLARRIVELAADRGLRERLGAAGRARAAAHHRPEQELDGLAALYATAIEQARPARLAAAG